MLKLKDKGSIVFDYGNNIRSQALEAGISNAFDFPGFVPEYIRPLFCEGKDHFGGWHYLVTQKIFIRQMTG